MKHDIDNLARALDDWKVQGTPLPSLLPLLSGRTADAAQRWDRVYSAQCATPIRPKVRKTSYWLLRTQEEWLVPLCLIPQALMYVLK